VKPRRKKRADHFARGVPGLGGVLGPVVRREAADVRGDFRREQAAVLHTAFVRVAFNVEHDPPRLRIPVRRAVTLHGARVRLEISGECRNCTQKRDTEEQV